MLAVPPTLPPEAQPAATYVAAALWALAREEQAGRKPKRLLEPGHATWARFRGRMGPRELVALLLEDAAVTQPEPFSFDRVLGDGSSLDALPEGLLGDWLSDLPRLPLDSTPREYIEEQAKLLGIQGRPAYSELPKLQPHHRVLELPGSGGRLATAIVESQSGIFFHDVFTYACASWQERMLVGLAAAGLGVVGKVRVSLDPELNGARMSGVSFSHVLGLRPEKGGAWSLVELTAWFSGCQIHLV